MNTSRKMMLFSEFLLMLFFFLYFKVKTYLTSKAKNCKKIKAIQEKFLLTK